MISLTVISTIFLLYDFDSIDCNYESYLMDISSLLQERINNIKLIDNLKWGDTKIFSSEIRITILDSNNNYIGNILLKRPLYCKHPDGIWFVEEAHATKNYEYLEYLKNIAREINYHIYECPWRIPRSLGSGSELPCPFCDSKVKKWSLVYSKFIFHFIFGLLIIIFFVLSLIILFRSLQR